MCGVGQDEAAVELAPPLEGSRSRVLEASLVENGTTP